MLRLSTMPANPEVANRWRYLCGTAIAGSGSASLLTLIGTLRELFPAGGVDEEFIYRAFGVSFLFSLPLAFPPKVISVSLAQLGFATSIVFLGCSLHGLFLPEFKVELLVILVIIVLLLLLIFSDGARDAYRQHSRSDLVLHACVLGIFLGLWVYPIVTIWRHS